MLSALPCTCQTWARLIGHMQYLGPEGKCLSARNHIRHCSLLNVQRCPDTARLHRRLGQKVFSNPGVVNAQKVEEGWRDSIYRSAWSDSG